MASPRTADGFIGMKKWDDAKQRWHAVICRVEPGDDGQGEIVVYDVEHKPTQVEIDDWIRDALATRPWETAKAAPTP